MRCRRAEDHLAAAENAVVVVGHRVHVGAGHGHGQDVADARGGQRGLADQDVAGFAVLADDRAGRAGEVDAIGEIGLVRRVVEHRAQVVEHAAVDADVPAPARPRGRRP